MLFDNENSDWLDDLEQFIRTILPVILLFLGVFGEQIGLPTNRAEILLNAGLFGIGLKGERKPKQDHESHHPSQPDNIQKTTTRLPEDKK